MGRFMVVRASLAIVAILLTGSVGVMAQQVSRPVYKSCGVDGYTTEPTPSAPPLVNATLSKFPSIAFSWCDDATTGHSYFMRTMEPSNDGLCFAHEVAVFSSVDPDGVDVL